jgi:hypothetical protein
MTDPRIASLPWTAQLGTQYSVEWTLTDGSRTYDAETLRVQVRRGDKGDTRDSLVACYPVDDDAVEIDVTGTDFESEPKVLRLKITTANVSQLLGGEPHWIQAKCTIDGNPDQVLVPARAFIVEPTVVAP